MSISETTRKRVRLAAGNRCGYCQIPGEYVYASMQIDHLLPIAVGGTDDEANLWLACPWCNAYKGDQTHAQDNVSGETTRLFNPRTDLWLDHFQWDAEDKAHIVGLSIIGRVTTTTLRLNNDDALNFRRLLVRLRLYPPNY